MRGIDRISPKSPQAPSRLLPAIAVAVSALAVVSCGDETVAPPEPPKPPEAPEPPKPPEPPDPGGDPDRAALVAFYNAAGGTGWLCNSGWLTDAPLDRWCGVEVDAGGRVTSLKLSWNQMEGRLSPALHRLEFLRVLDLAYNRLDGPIPPEFGQLEMLEVLDLTYNGADRIPSELTTLPRLRRLILKGTSLAGPLPRELVNLPELRDLDLALNDISGSLPPGLTGMRHLSSLSLADNPVTGPVPEDIGRLSTLTALNLTNTNMSGTLPHSLTRIEGLDLLLTGGTELCGPDDERFWGWLRVVQTQRVQPCEALASGSTAYLTQAVQSRRFPVPLVADEEALLRVFAVAPQAAGQPMPPVRATFYLDGAEAEVVEISSDASFIRDRVDESSLTSSANAVIPASVIRPGLEMAVEIDPDGTLDAALGVARRIPETGRIDVDVREMPVLALTLIPLLYAPAPDSSLLDITDGLEAEDPLLWAIRTLMPVRELDLTVHEPVTTNSTHPHALVQETEAIRVAERGQGYYMATLPESQADFPGISIGEPGRSTFAIPDAWVMVHELGHNLGLRHAPCGPNQTNIDFAYPHRDGSIGAWGYDFEDGALVPPTKPDFMSYCGPDVWVSEYFHANMLRYRFEVEGSESAAATAAGPSLLVWGGTEPNGAPFLEPAFVLDAPAALPSSSGPYRVTGVASDGATLFSLSFDMPRSFDGEGGASFAFAVPAQTSWAGRLRRITLTGPDGSVSLDAQTERPAAMIRNPRTGQIRAIYRDLPSTMTRAEAAALSPEPGLEILFSRGLPDATEWLP
ncbi:M66 family metalloprotease [Candidatus Palauibacter sp.]|uniref:leucine-rich repeat domain-containing protein n=1 Tax=Candidatus Palauibacter sp. TaxID=3101350 RepID=UPI003AF2EA2E